ncbi:MAG: transglutaminase family protein [Planctomycetaceae bacterium]|nr:transglutaminase family protein [Planctomycetaceae bacterium]
MKTHVVLLAAIVALSGLPNATAQFKQGETGGPKVGKSEVTQWQIGVLVKAASAACRGGNGYISVPMDWPEQEVNVVKEEVSPEIKIRYTQMEHGLKVMNVKLGQLTAGREAKALVTFEIRRSAVLPPDKTDIYELPDVKKLPRDVRPYLTQSPKIESHDPRIRELAKTIGVYKAKPWNHVEAIYDWVREKVKYKPGKLKGALAALRDGTGDCEEISSLFIAICRAADIPARSVWVPGHCYAEFYLVDDKGEGHWFPCQSAGAREFGGISDLRPIWQKGDNIYSPIKKERQRYLDFDMLISGNVRPEVRATRAAIAKPN